MIIHWKNHETAHQKIAEGILFTDLYQLTMAQPLFPYRPHQRWLNSITSSAAHYGAILAGCINASLMASRLDADHRFQKTISLTWAA
jgi:nicotinic acid phosphoribosyltransferase